MQKNKKLNTAKRNKRDEFYTQLVDVERELRHYKERLKGKIVFCNCDDPEESHFWKYFALNFDFLGLKKLISTHYDYEKPTYKLEMTEEGVKRTDLKENGDFRSSECVQILKEADVVITNPPFSLFREYVAQLLEYQKKFIIIGHQNAISYTDTFKLIKEDKMWLGYGFKRNAAHFINKHYEDYAVDDERKEGMIRVSGVVWFTNFDIRKRHEDIILYKTYVGNESDYPRYDDYEAINVDKVKDIPIDYEGAMGVPITFIDKYNPEQFEIIDAIGRHSLIDGPTEERKGLYLTKINGKKKYTRIIIKNKKL